METVYRTVGIIVVWLFYGAVLFGLIFMIRVIWYLITRLKVYQNINSWVWFYILRKTLPSENIMYAYKNYGYWRYAAKYRLRNIKRATKNK